jgi:hypothetical protein
MLLSDPAHPLVATTAYRHTRLELDGPQWVLYNGAWKLDRDADQITPAGLDTPAFNLGSSNVFRLPGAGWILEPTLLSQRNQLLTANAGQMYDGPAFANLAPGIEGYYRWRQENLSGVTYDGDLAEQAMPAYEKAIAAGSPFACNLVADQLAYPGPPAESLVPTTRLFSGRRTEPRNQAIQFSFFVPPVGEPGDVLYRLLWGGPADMLPTTKRGGEWGLTYRGDGTASLWARIDGEWARQGTAQWSDGVSARGGWAHTYLQPHGKNRLFIYTQAGTGKGGGLRRLGSERLPADFGSLSVTVHRHSALATGYGYRTGITGPGTFRIDARADLAARFAIGATGYPTEGLLVDRPFSLPFTVPADTLLRLKLRTLFPAGTGVDIQGALYEADTGLALVPGDNAGEYLIPAGVKHFFGRFVLTGSGTHTPVLTGVTYELDARLSSVRIEEAALLQAEFAAPTDVDLLGSDQDVTHEGGHLEIHDLTDELVPLRTRDGVPIRIFTTVNEEGDESCIFEGEASAIEETVHLAAPGNPSYPFYSVELAGQWARVAEQRVIGNQPYGLNRDTGKPDRVTNIIRELFTDAGVPAEQMDIPDLPLEFWPSENEGAEIYILQSGTSYLDAIQNLARRYLDAWIAWAPNSGPYGQWKLRLNPADPASNILWDFVTEAPEVIGLGGLPVPAAQHVADTYGEATTFIRSLRRKRKRPEYNSVYVFNSPDMQGKISAYEHNPRSFSRDAETPTADPGHIDYIGREVPESFYDPTIETQQQANWIARRLLDLGGFGRILYEFEAPLVFVTDPNDADQVRPRKLMIGDPVAIDGKVGVLRPCSAAYRDDVLQLAEYQVAMLPGEGV